MESIFQNIPNEVLLDLQVLKTALDQDIPKKTEDSLLIATWNIRAFGELTQKWESGGKDSPKRDLHSLLCIIEIISRFDVIAVQEVKGNLKCLRETMKHLGESWSFLMTDVTRGDAGNGERLAFLFNNKRVHLSGLACEIVVPQEQLQNNIGKDALVKQFARTPYAVGFRAREKTFVLLTLHVLYGDNAADRVPELKAIAEWMYDWAKTLKRWNQSLIILGDFNIERRGDEAYEAFVSRNLFIPPKLNDLSRTIFQKVTFYDQIGWFLNSRSDEQLSMELLDCGIFEFKNKLLSKRKLSDQQLSFRISDHYPLWCQFRL